MLYTPQGGAAYSGVYSSGLVSEPGCTTIILSYNYRKTLEEYAIRPGGRGLKRKKSRGFM
jgi:hypothetical protein